MLQPTSPPPVDTTAPPASPTGAVDTYVDERVAAEHVLVNMSAARVNLAIGDGQVLHLAPLERRRITRSETSRIDLGKVRRSPYVKIERVNDRLLRPPAARVFRFAVVALVLLLGVVVPVLGSLGLLQLLDALWLTATALVVAAGLTLGGGYVSASNGGGWLAANPDVGRGVRTKVAHLASQLAVLVAAVVIPGAATWYLGGFRTAMQGVTTVRGAASALEVLLAGPGNTALAAAWLLQLVLISAASMLPALLFFMFDRTRLSTLKHQLLQQIFRLEPDLRTLSDVDAKYGPQIEETFGSGPKNGGRFAAGTRLPVVFATILIAAGWTVLVIHTDQGLATDVSQPGFRLISFWSSPPDLVGYAFLGAYVFALRLTLRGYMRSDLRAKSYSAISVRLLSVVVLAWLLKEFVSVETATSGPLLAAAFFGGFFPDERMQQLKELVGRNRLSRKFGAAKWPAVPTNDLDTLAGLDVYDRARLAQEGINNVQGLAKADLVTLLMNVRVPAGRLFDWVDRAVLQLHVGPCGDAGKGDGAKDGDGAPRAQPMRRRLEDAGIRTATQVATQGTKSTMRDDDPAWCNLKATLKADPTVSALMAYSESTHADRSPICVDAVVDRADDGRQRTAGDVAHRLWVPSMATWTVR